MLALRNLFSIVMENDGYAFFAVLIGLQWLYGALLSDGVSISSSRSSNWVSVFVVKSKGTNDCDKRQWQIQTNKEGKWHFVECFMSNVANTAKKSIFVDLLNGPITHHSWIVPCFQLILYKPSDILQLVSTKKFWIKISVP